MIVCKFRLPDNINTPTNAKPIAISYAMICAADLIEPRKAYFELDAQPARITPYTLNDVKARINNNPALMFEIIKNSDNGITDQTNNEGTNINIGAVRNIALLALEGIIISLETNFRTSAMG